MYSDYEVIQHSNMHELIKTVNKALDAGYVPIGGVDAAGSAFYQAIAKPRLMTAMVLNSVPVPAKAKKPKKKKK